jgi:hypothetical protein
MEVINVSGRLEEAFNLLKLLRPDLIFTEFQNIFDISNKNDSYNLFGIENEQQELIGLIGF